MSKYLDKFPTILYDIQKDGRGNRVLLTNTLFRLKIFDALKGVTSTYYEWFIEDSDTIEILAEKIYNDPECHWVIAYMNDMTDPLFDWPRDYSSFGKYIRSKYGSQATAMSQIHHYEMTTERKSLDDQVTDTMIIHIDKETFDNIPTYSYVTYTLQSGKTIEETIRTREVDCFEWEEKENEKKRTIKILKPDYISQVKQEFDEMLKKTNTNLIPEYYRSLRNY